MSWNFYISFNFLWGLKGNQWKVNGYLYTLGNYTKTNTTAGRGNMVNQKFKTGLWSRKTSARFAQGLHKSHFRAKEFSNLAQPPLVRVRIQTTVPELHKGTEGTSTRSWETNCFRLFSFTQVLNTWKIHGIFKNIYLKHEQNLCKYTLPSEYWFSI